MAGDLELYTQSEYIQKMSCLDSNRKHLLPGWIRLRTVYVQIFMGQYFRKFLESVEVHKLKSQKFLQFPRAICTYGRP